MRLGFCSLDVLGQTVREYGPDFVVSIWSPRHPVDAIQGREWWDFVFDDVEERTLRTSGRTFPDYCHIEGLLDLLAKSPQRLLLHCTAGLSRSPALAIVASVHQGRSASATCAEVRRLAPRSQPNRMVLEMADQVLGRAILPAALSCFTYTRGSGMPDGERAGFVELSGQAVR